MSKDPAFLFYPNDYLGGTMGFSFEQHGAYLLLLIYQFNNGPFSIEKAVSIVGCSLFESIRNKFEEKDGCICNARLMQEIEKRKDFSLSRRENAEKGWKKRKNNMQVHSICNDGALHMGNRNENENRIKDEDEDEDTNPIYRFCSTLLKNRIQEKRKAVIDEPKLKKWDKVVRLMLDRDHYSQQDIIDTINACHDMAPTASGFTWADNILSMDTLRTRMKEGKVYPDMNNKPKAQQLYGKKEYTKEDFKHQMEFLKDE